VPTLIDRITRRGRSYEQEIRPEYLSQLNDLYEDWIHTFTLCPVLTVPAGDLNYVAHDSALDLIVSKIYEKLEGKEEVIFAEDELARVNAQLD
jgi:deoxyadenosine/deoxycytidine kinase